MQRWRFALIYAAAWIPVACLYTLLIFFQRGSLDQSPTLLESLAGSLWTTTTAALLGLIVWRISQRLVGTGRPVRIFFTHVALAVAYGVAWSGAVIVSMLGAPALVRQQFIERAAGWQALTGMLLYGLIAGIASVAMMSRRLREQHEAARHSEMLRTRAELDALRSRMDPHFLFNTLHSITALSRTDPAAVAPALERLAELLRYVLSMSKDVRDDVPLADELTFVRDYLSLEQLRLGARLTVVEDIDPEALDCVIPAFTLQPLVENAIRHGISDRVEGGTLRVLARVEHDQLTLEVTDDGAGAHAVNALNASGVGLQAVVQRVQARHRDRGKVEVFSTPGTGFTVRLSVPASVTLHPVSP